MGGVAVIVLAILALAGVLRPVLTDIAGIVFGAAFIIEGAALTARHAAIMDQVGDSPADQLEMGGGMTVELAGGIAAIALGILALVGVVPTILMPALVITGGAALILSAGAVQRLNDIRAEAFGLSQTARGMARGAVSSAAAGQVLAGLGAVTLGILALVGVGTPAVLTMVGLLVLGAAITLSGTAMSGKMLNLFRHA
ncbi:MAG TPA: hypothetical protein VHV27_04530 [Phenylobacterium sp.]|jgi:hypothetical protein|nr:hypothetical protein [Phenylobacterium sp.]